MTLTSLSRDLYSLDTLDTRFTTSANTPLKVANDESAKSNSENGGRQSAPPEGASRSRFTTPEYIFYFIVFAISIPNMYWAAVQVSQPDSSSYSKYQHLLSDGWLFGRKVDNSDGQYAGFRDNIPYLTVLVALHPLARRLYEKATGILSPDTVGHGTAKPETMTAAAEKRLQARLRFDMCFAVLFIVALHGFSAFKILLIVYINFMIGRVLPRHLIPAATWTFNIAILFANELSRGFLYTNIAVVVSPFYASADDVGKFFDSWGGLIPRWEVLFNITILRLISYNMDYYWSLDRSRTGSPVELKKKQLTPSVLSERDRIKTPAPSAQFNSFGVYVAYTLYSPLYLAGPVVTFNDYISQSTYPSPSITTRRTTLYGVRFLLTLFCMEFLLHTVYVVAISKSDPEWSTYTPFQLSMLAYFNLHIIWLKLLIPWRFFRLWSLVDGIDPPENMIRCMSDNYSTQAFWRSWHRSLNRWIIRYIYIPLGGGPGGGTGKVKGIVNMVLVFTFVALWHDINLKLLMWGWIVVLFVLPEVLATMAFPAKAWKDRPTAYRMLCGIGGVANVLMMMTANLIGFALGLEGLKGLVAGIIGSWQGALFLLTACGVLFTGVQVMFEHREQEKRKGVNLKC